MNGVLVIKKLYVIEKEKISAALLEKTVQLCNVG